MNAVEYVRATAACAGSSRRIVAFLDDYDLLLTPTLAQPPVAIGALEDEDPWVQFANAGQFTPFTQVANITGLPAVSLPLSWSDDGLPIGVQLVGRPADEATLFRVSAQLERRAPGATAARPSAEPPRAGTQGFTTNAWHRGCAETPSIRVQPPVQARAFGGTVPSSSTARSASTQSIPIASRVSCVAEPRWGTRTTFSSSSRPGCTSGSRSKTSRAAPAIRPLAQRRDERLLVDDRPAAGVDEHGRRLHPRERGRVDQVAALVGQRQVQRDDVGGGEQLVERHAARCGCCGSTSIP